MRIKSTVISKHSVVSVSSAETKKAFIASNPDFENHPWWNEDGMPAPDPATLVNKTAPRPLPKKPV